MEPQKLRIRFAARICTFQTYSYKKTSKYDIVMITQNLRECVWRWCFSFFQPTPEPCVIGAVTSAPCCFFQSGKHKNLTPSLMFGFYNTAAHHHDGLTPQFDFKPKVYLRMLSARTCMSNSSILHCVGDITILSFIVCVPKISIGVFLLILCCRFISHLVDQLNLLLSAIKSNYPLSWIQQLWRS